MRALGWPYLVAVASVIEITSCSVTPAARTSCNHLSNWRIGLGSTEALFKGTGCLVIEAVSVQSSCFWLEVDLSSGSFVAGVFASTADDRNHAASKVSQRLFTALGLLFLLGPH